MSNQRQRKTYYAKQAAKPCKTQQTMRKKTGNSQSVQKNVKKIQKMRNQRQRKTY